jgi:small conductance mechanosensitive channel
MSMFNQLKDDGLTDPGTFQGAILYAIVFIFLAWLFGHTLRLTVKRMLTHGNHDYLDRMAVKFLSELARLGVYMFALISYAHIVPALKVVGKAWLASVGIISVIVGLAAQNTLGNLIAGISLLIYRPFKLGDRLQVTAPSGLETGIVESLALGYTLLKTDDNRRIVIPNSVMASQTTINMTGDDPRLICSVPFNISYDSDLDKVRAIIVDLAAKHPKAQVVDACQVTKLAASSVELTLEVWCKDALTADILKSDLLEQAKKRFAVEGIQIPYPHTMLILPPEFLSKFNRIS